ncbi:conjugal transfer protein [Listeria aquatica]|uniref:conjugal transfer protein n=1 Tax=Listeria aquatica TaxID=1494960 RepID=UPI003F722A30
MFQKLKATFLKANIQKEKKEKRKLPHSRTHGKGIRMLLWILIFGIAVSGILGYFKAVKVDHRTASIQKEIKKQRREASNSMKQESENPMLLFTDDFIQHFLNVPENQEERERYKETLKSYLADGVSLDYVDTSQGKRDLKDSTFFNLLTKNGQKTVQYKVTYENVTFVEKEKIKKEKYKEGDKEKVRDVKEKVKEPSKKEVTCLLNVPVQETKQGQYTVVENPYFSSIPKLNSSKGKAITDSLANSELEPLSANQEEAVKKFVDGFFEKYASSSKEDMVFIMKTPESLNGLKTFEEVTNFKSYRLKKNSIVKCSVTFKDKDTQMVDEEVFTLELTRKEGQFFVSNLTHTLGGDNQ